MAYPTPNYIAAVPVQQDSHIIQELSSPIYQARGWLKFLGVLSIISGIGQALSIVGIIYAWLPIWMGVLLYQAGSSAEAAATLGDRFAFMNSLGSLKTYFVIQGVMAMIGIIVTLLILCVFIVLPLFGATIFALPDLQELFNI
jgi:hypothetical protein